MTIDFAGWIDGQAVIASFALFPAMWRIAKMTELGTLARSMGAWLAIHAVGGILFFGSRLMIRSIGGSPANVLGHLPEPWPTIIWWIFAIAASFLVAAKVGLVWVGEGQRATRLWTFFISATFLWTAAALIL